MSGKKFTLKMTFEDFGPGEKSKCNPGEMHFGVPWDLLMINRATLYLCCEWENVEERPWSIEATIGMRVFSGMRYICSIKESTVTFSDINHGWFDYFDYNEAKEKITIDENTVVFCDIVIHQMTGIAPKRKRSFEEPDEHLTDVILMVDDEKFHVSKVTLAGQSSYFKAMFFGCFNEAKKSEIELKDVDPDVFQKFLEVIYGQLITAEYVAELLILADKFDVPSVRDRCEEYMLGSDQVKKEEKLRLADAFKLEKLMEQCLNSMKTPEDFKSFLPFHRFFLEKSHTTLVAILERKMSLRK